MFKSDAPQVYVPSKSIAIKPDVVSDVGGNDQIRINIPSYVGFVDPNQTYLKFDLQISNARGMLVPDKNCGGHALIRNIRYRDGNNQTQLELNDDYNSNYSMLSNYTSQQNILHKRELFSGMVKHIGDNNDDSNLYYGPRSIAAGSTIGAPDTTVRSSLKPTLQFQLNSGLFKQGKIIPVSAMNGMKIVIDTDDIERSFQYLDLFGDKTLSDVVGYRIRTTGAKAVGDDARDGSAVNQQASIALDIEAKFSPFDIGDKIYISNPDTPNTNEEELGVVSGFSKTGNNLNITYIPQRGLSAGLALIHAVGSHVYFKVAERALEHTTIGISDTGNVKTKVFPKPSYAMSDVEMIVQSVSPPEAYQNGILKASQSAQGIQFDLLTYELYRHNQSNLSGLLQAQIPTTARRAKAIFSQPLVSAYNRDIARSSFQGVPDGARSYEFIHGTKHMPSRLVPLERYSVAAVKSTILQETINLNEALHTSELQKAIINIGEPVHSLQKISNHFSIARSLSKYGGTTDLDGETLSLRVDYNNGLHNKIFNNYVYCLRRVMIKNGVVDASNQVPPGV